MINGRAALPVFRYGIHGGLVVPSPTINDVLWTMVSWGLLLAGTRSNVSQTLKRCVASEPRTTTLAELRIQLGTYQHMRAGGADVGSLLPGQRIDHHPTLPVSIGIAWNFLAVCGSRVVESALHIIPMRV